MTDKPARWAIERAIELAAEKSDIGALNCPWAINAFARYIQQHEEPPVDPLLIEARKILRAHEYVYDSTLEEQMVLAAIKRGIEIGRSEA